MRSPAPELNDGHRRIPTGADIYQLCAVEFFQDCVNLLVCISRISRFELFRQICPADFILPIQLVDRFQRQSAKRLFLSFAVRLEGVLEIAFKALGISVVPRQSVQMPR